MLLSYVYMNVKYPYKYGSLAAIMAIKKKEQMKVNEWVDKVGRENIKTVLDFDGGWVVLKDTNEQLAKAYKKEAKDAHRTRIESK